MTSSLRAAAVAMAVLVGGCAKQVIVIPTEAKLSLAGKQATWRDWSKVKDVCLVDQSLFGGDLDSMNALLLEFLSQTSAGPDGYWSDENIALLEEGQRALPGPLDATQKGVFQAERATCRFEGLTRTSELLAMTRRRLESAPELLAVVKAKLALAKWKDSQPMVTQTAKEAACPTTPPTKKELVVYYSFEDDKGRVEWLFCDGKKVYATPGTLPAFDAGPPPPRKGGAPNAQAYLDAAGRFPAGQVNRAPRVPVKRPAKKDDAPEPEF